MRVKMGRWVLNHTKVVYADGRGDIPSGWCASVLQGGFYPSKISGVGTNFGLLVHVIPGPNKDHA